MSYFPPIDFNVAVRLGEVAGYKALGLLCHSENMNTNNRIIHHEMGVADLDVDGLLDTPSTVKVASTSANDTNTAGTGARTVKIEGLVSGAEDSEILALNGLTEVTSTKTYSAVTRMIVLTAGATGSNEGAIWAGNGTFTSGVPATKYDSMGIGHNLNGLGYRVVPTGYQWVVRTLNLECSDTTKIMTFIFWVRDAATGLWLNVFEVDLKGDSAYNVEVQSFPPIAAGSAVKITASVDSGTATVAGGLGGYLVAV